MASVEGSRPVDAAAVDAAAGSFEYLLPPELIAQQPPAERDGARLLVVDRARDAFRHGTILDLPSWLRRGDLLVVNRSRVIPARLHARRAGGGAAEVLLVAPLDAADDVTAGATRWKALVRPARRLRSGQRLTLVPPPATASTATATRC
jgi:S-adenosylmethionine:tRNA ribosyltransferase-isomerase